jgi:hypothetical protein
MATLLEQLQRESDDLCGHRGLQPGSDHQVSRPVHFPIDSIFEFISNKTLKAIYKTYASFPGLFLGN